MVKCLVTNMASVMAKTISLNELNFIKGGQFSMVV